jgi:hypothetical protein
MTANEILDYCRKERNSKPSNNVILELDADDCGRLVDAFEALENKLKAAIQAGSILAYQLERYNIDVSQNLIADLSTVRTNGEVEQIVHLPVD